MSEADRTESASTPAAAIVGKAPFVEGLRGWLEDRRADGRSLAVLIIDCGLIGRIDGAWGYHVGDAVRARLVAGLRAEVIRPSDLLGEMGRDDLAFVLWNVESTEVAVLAAEKSLRALNNVPIWIDDEQIYARPAIGIAMCPEHGDEAESLLRRAKSACVAARDQTGRIAVHADDRESLDAARLIYENRLRAAVVDDGLDMVFQPQYELRSGHIMGTEGLLRWRTDGREPVSVTDAFAVAESAGLIAELISSVLNRALRNCSEFRYSAGLDLRIAVKFPGRVLLWSELPDIVERALRTWMLRPGRLMIEIGETGVLGTHPEAREMLERLKTLGVKLSIDDADMTLASLFRLATLPFQEMKIDLSAARDSMGLPQGERIVQSLVELAHRLELEVVAVGVADDASATLLRELGCDYMQADYKGPALDPEEFVARYAG